MKSYVTELFLLASSICVLEVLSLRSKESTVDTLWGDPASEVDSQEAAEAAAAAPPLIPLTQDNVQVHDLVQVRPDYRQLLLQGTNEDLSPEAEDGVIIEAIKERCHSEEVGLRLRDCVKVFKLAGLKAQVRTLGLPHGRVRVFFPLINAPIGKDFFLPSKVLVLAPESFKEKVKIQDLAKWCKQQDLDPQSGLLRSKSQLVRKIGKMFFSNIGLQMTLRIPTPDHLVTLTVSDLGPLPAPNLKFPAYPYKEASKPEAVFKARALKNEGTTSTKTPKQESEEQQKHSYKNRMYITIGIAGFVAIIILAMIPFCFRQDHSETLSTLSEIQNDSLAVESQATRRQTNVANVRSTAAPQKAAATSGATAAATAAATAETATAAPEVAAPAPTTPALAKSGTPKEDVDAAQSEVIGQVRSMHPASGPSPSPEEPS